MSLLRDLETSERLFWKDTLSEQLKFKVLDNRSYSETRPLPGNEIAAMALMEIAVAKGRGFFQYLPNRLTWQAKQQDKALHPPSRMPDQPGSDFPNLTYVDYAWTDAARQKFLTTNHRFRFLACNALINPPMADTPVYGMQYVATKRYQMYVTSRDSLMILATDRELFCTTVSELAKPQAIGRRLAHKPALAGPEPGRRLDTALYIWEGTGGDAAKELKMAAIRRFQLDSMESLYEYIVDACQPHRLSATLSAQDLQRTIPHARAPEPGLALGIPVVLNKEHRAASRRQKKNKRAAGEMDIGEGHGESGEAGGGEGGEEGEELEWRSGASSIGKGKKGRV